tara:strand:- start:2433 stop:2603 length:171 start_codon:yes stop_codon:yes gene_type:complete
MLTEQELIELLRSQIDTSERTVERLSELLREAYNSSDNKDMKDQIEDLFTELDMYL